MKDGFNPGPKRSAEILDIDAWRSGGDWRAVVARRRALTEGRTVGENVAARQTSLNLERAEADFDKLYATVDSLLSTRVGSAEAKIAIDRLFNNLTYIKEINGEVPAHIYHKMDLLNKKIETSSEGPGGGPAAA